MITIVLSLVFFMALMVQTTFFKMYGPAAPDAALLMSIYCGLQYMKVSGYQVGILTGLVQDVLSFGLLGVNLLSKGLIGFTSGLLAEGRLIDPRSPSTWFTLIIMATFIDRVIMQVYTSGFFGASYSFVGMAWSFLVGAMVNVLAGIPFFYFLNKLQEQLKDFLGIRQF